MGRNRRARQRARELQQAKTMTIARNNGHVHHDVQPVDPVVVQPPADDTTMVETQVMAEADVVKAADIPFSVRLLNFIKNTESNGTTIDDICDWVPDVKRSSVTARVSEYKRKGLVEETGATRVGSSGRPQNVIVAK